MRKCKAFRALTCGFCVLLLGACASPAGPGEFRARSSSINTASSIDALESDVEAEIEFGRELAARVLGHYGLYEDARLTRYLNLVGHSVAMHGQRPELQFRFAILDTDAINAYAAPGGYIFVTRGALGLMRDEAELAAVLAHEIAHVDRRHIVRELNIRGTDESPESGLARMFGASADPARVAFNQALDKAVELLLSEGLKREDEYDADSVGLMTLIATGYDAVALSRYLVRVKSVSNERVDVLHQTHPPIDARVAALNALTRDAALAGAGEARAQIRFETFAGNI